ncbi:pyrroline-5-carboxylate reductase dimerization domain-containing protein [Pseudomonas sp. Y136_2_1_1]|uniref:pyrroline-5-carboxylate reductase family protein n=1 Tax=Pseudomonas taetrolens TaxID=47884 RepID=UPI001040CE73
MRDTITIGIIGGTGWLGRSIATALLDSGFVGPESLILSSRSGELKGAEGSLASVQVTDDNQRLVGLSDVVILSVRPEDLAAVKIDLADTLLVSLVAGVSLHDIALHSGARRVVRAMPNAALELRTSYTPWLANEQVDGPDKILVQRLFETCGEADEVFSENDLDYLTALSGTGPSYPALLAKALYDGAIAQGLSETVARRAVTGVVVHASQLISETRGFEALLDTLVGYRGVSAAGIQGMTAGGLAASVSAGISRAHEVAQSRLFDVKVPGRTE